MWSSTNFYAGLWRGRRRLAKKLNPDLFVENNYLKYLGNLQVGNLYHGCGSIFNRRIEKIEYIYSLSRNTKTRVLVAIEISGKNSYCCTDGGCIDLPRSTEEITRMIMWYDNADGKKYLENWPNPDMITLVEQLKAGATVKPDGTGLDNIS